MTRYSEASLLVPRDANINRPSEDTSRVFQSSDTIHLSTTPQVLSKIKKLEEWLSERTVAARSARALPITRPSPMRMLDSGTSQVFFVGISSRIPPRDNLVSAG